MPETLTNTDLSPKEIAELLIKEKGIEGQEANVVVCITYAGRSRNLYASGYMQKLLERILPLANAFNENGQMDVYIFQNDAYRIMPAMSVDNAKGYVQQNILNKYNCGMTSYTPAINLIVNKFVRDNNASVDKQTIGNKVSTWFGGDKKLQTKQVTAEKPTLVLFITDSENDDKADAQQAIVDAAKHGIYFHMWGLQTPQSDKFSFLTKLDDMMGKFINNADFKQVTDKQIVLDDSTPDKAKEYMNDKTLYSMVLSEFPAWTKEARVKQLIK